MAVNLPEQAKAIRVSHHVLELLRSPNNDRKMFKKLPPILSVSLSHRW
jgi:hypothetical protein